MKQKIASLIALIIICHIFSFTLVPTAFATSDELGNLIKDQLQPVEDVYSPNADVSPSTFPTMIAQIIQTALLFLGIIFLVLIIYAGFMWMTAAGNEDKISTAKKTMTAAIIGAAIILSAYAITYFVLNQLLVVTRGTSLK